MENKDNNIVVNAKPNTIILQSTEEEVTGGYYDGAGEWHEFGGESGDITFKKYKAKTNTVPYTDSSTFNYLFVFGYLENYTVSRPLAVTPILQFYQTYTQNGLGLNMTIYQRTSSSNPAVSSANWGTHNTTTGEPESAVENTIFHLYMTDEVWAILSNYLEEL